MRIVLTVFLLIICVKLKSQITFEKTYTFTSGYAIEEMPDGSFIGCGDSVQTGLIFKMDRLGNLTSTFYPTLRNTNIGVEDISSDPLTGGYAICGRAVDTIAFESAYYLLLDSQMHSTDSLFFSGGVGSGPSATNILRTLNNDFIIGISIWNGAGSYEYVGQKIEYPTTLTWDVVGGQSHTTNGIALGNDGNLLFASFSWTSVTAAYFSMFDTVGNYLNGFGIGDTAYGGSFVFESVTAAAPDGNNMFAVHLSPNSGSNTVEYLTKLDSTSNVIWEKYLDWGYNLNVIAISPTSDSCIVLLLSTDNGLAIHKLNLNGDSLWTQFHNRPTSGFGNRFQQCADHGFVVVGQLNDSIGNHGYVLKTDSLGRLLPDVTINISGDLEFCQGDSTQLTAQAGLSYLWSTGETTQSITIYITGSYFLTVEDSSGKQAISDSIHIVVHPLSSQPTISDSNGVLYSSLAISYQWFIDGLLINNSDSIALVATQTGFYTVKTMDSNGCSSTSNSYYHNLTEVSKLESNNLIKIYPNPSEGNFIIELNHEHLKFIRLELFDIMGRKVYEQEKSFQKQLELEFSLSSGIYYLSVSSYTNNIYKIIIN